MATNDPTPNAQISDIAKIVNLGTESVLVVKLTQQVPEGTKVNDIKLTLDPPLPGGGCGIQVG